MYLTSQRPKIPVLNQLETGSYPRSFGALCNLDRSDTLTLTFANPRRTMRRSTTPLVSRASALDELRLQEQETRIRILERAFEAEQQHRREVEQKYARLKRQYIRLERAHARLRETRTEALPASFQSPSLSSPPTQPTQATEQDDSTTDIIDLTSPTHSRRTSLAAGAASEGLSPQQSFFSEDFCAQSPTSPEDSAAVQPNPTPSRRSPVRRSPVLTSERTASPATSVPPASSSRRRHLEFSTPQPSSRPRPRLGTNSPEVSLSVGLSRWPPSRSQSTSPEVTRSTIASNLYAAPAALHSSSTILDDDDDEDSSEAASLALAQYLQQQENEAAIREYEQRLIESNSYEFASSSAAPPSRASTLQHTHVDPDNMTYEELLQLGEQVGDVKKERWREVSVQVLSSLPTHRWSSRSSDDVSCIICQCCFDAGEVALTLPCAHVFHEDCVTGWVRENNSCPLCKMAIADV